MEQVVTPLDRIIQLLPYLAPLFLLQLTLQVIALVDLLRRERTRGPKWIWAVLIILGQLLGAIIYLIFGRKEQSNGVNPY